MTATVLEKVEAAANPPAPKAQLGVSDELGLLAAALAKAQALIKPAIKDATNPHFKSKFADLASVWEAIRVPLATNGLAVSQLPTVDGNKVTVTTLLLHASGQWIRSDLTMVVAQNTPQGIGSCITYARRYALSAVVGVVAELDDDGNGASK